MRIGFQTICFGERLRKEDWEKFIPSLREAGYEGVEIFQHPNDLPSYGHLLRLGERHGVDILGFTGGTLRRRIEYLEEDSAALAKHQPYLYIEDKTEKDEEGHFIVDLAIAKRHRLALHYHHLCQLQSFEEAVVLLLKHPEMEWLPDTAHLFINQQKTDSVVEKLLRKDLEARTKVIHIKDWTPIFGRFSHRFAKGFRSLGEGKVGVERIVKRIANSNDWKPWVVAELDYSEEDPVASMLDSANVLRKWINGSQGPTISSFSLDAPPKEGAHAWENSLEDLLRMAGRGEPGFYDGMAEWLAEISTAQEVHVCAIVNSLQEPTLRGSSTGGAKIEQAERDEVKDSARLALKARTHVSSLGQGEEEKWFAVPVLNPYNPNLIRHVLVYRLGPNNIQSQKDLLSGNKLRVSLGYLIDIFVAELCHRAAAEATHLASEHRNRHALIQELAQLLKDLLGCEGVSIFSESLGQELELGGTTGIQWRSGLEEWERKYELGRGVTGEIAEKRSYRILRLVPKEDGTEHEIVKNAFSWETVPDKDKKAVSVLVSCFFNEKDQVAGVVRCRNPIDEQGRVLYFTEDDLSLVEAVMLSTQTILERMRQEEHRSKAFTMLSHELSNPITFFRGTVYDLRKSVETVIGRKLELKHDHFEIIDARLSNMVRVLRDYQYSVEGDTPDQEMERSEVLFFADVVAPCVRQLRFALAKRKFDALQIDYGDEKDWKRIPALWVDRSLMEQVAFNLLDNAVKYAKDSPRQFKVQIRGERVSEGVHIYFKDYGIGIPKKYKDMIFLRGGRVPADRRIVGKKKPRGHGLGLWVVAKIVKQHGGRIELLTYREDHPPSQENYTEFRIFLPASCIAMKSTKGTH